MIILLQLYSYLILLSPQNFTIISKEKFSNKNKKSICKEKNQKATKLKPRRVISANGNPYEPNG